VRRFLILIAAALAIAGRAAAAPARPQILTGDVERFYRIYEAAGGHPTAEQLDRDYLAPGSAGLHAFAQLRTVTGGRIAKTNADHPEATTTMRATRIRPCATSWTSRTQRPSWPQAGGSRRAREHGRAATA